MKMKQIISLLLSFVMVLGMLSGCGNNQPETTDPVLDTTPSKTQENTEPVGTMEFDSTLEAIRVVVDGVVHTFDVGVLDGVWYLSAKDAETAFGGNFTEDYVALDSYAKAEDIRYIQDEVLTAAYINTWKPYEVNKWDVEFNIYDDGTDFERAFYMGLVDESMRNRADEQITSTEFRAMLADLVAKFAPDKITDFDANVLDADLPLTRSDGITMAYYAAVCLGIDSYNVGFDSNIAYPNGWNEANAALFPNWNNGPTAYRWEDSDTDEYWDDAFSAALFWAIGRRSTVSRTLMFTLNRETGDMNIDGSLNVRDAVSALTRLYDCVGARSYNELRMESFEELPVELLTTPSPLLSEVHIAKANEALEVTAENHPQWTGIGLDWEEEVVTLSEDNIYRLANWGFNSIRINFNYRYLFNTDGDAYLSNLANLQKLDAFIAAAIECGVHIDLCMTKQPGREAYRLEGFTTQGDFDLFINPDKQEKAIWVWSTLAARYKDIPNYYLSFTPIWETLNSDLTTGLGAPEYPPGDVGTYFAKLVDSIHGYDEDRLINYELNGGDKSLDEPIIDAVANKSNVLGVYNYMDEPFGYYSMRVPEEGGDGDSNNHSFPLPTYPLYVYSVCELINQDTQINFDGCLPAGTVINLYVHESFGTTLDINADGTTLYSENIPVSTYPIDYHRSIFHCYAKTEKCISVTLVQDTDVATLSASGSGLQWSGIDVILPEEYAREYWYFNSSYDAFLGWVDEEGMVIRNDSVITIAPTQDHGVGTLRHDEAGRTITIHDDATYTTDVLWYESSAKSKYEYISSAYTPVGGDPIVRLETPYFTAAAWEDIAAYYADAYGIMNDQNISWLSNDFEAMTVDYFGIAGANYVQYDEYESFNLELLKLLQQYQNTVRP